MDRIEAPAQAKAAGNSYSPILQSPRRSSTLPELAELDEALVGRSGTLLSACDGALRGAWGGRGRVLGSGVLRGRRRR